MKKYLLMAGLLASGLSFAQDGFNMVENGSFESLAGKGPKKLGGIDGATNWLSATGAKADLFLAGSKIPEIEATNNMYGKETAQHGSNFAGIMVYSPANKLPRTYITQQMNGTMKKGESYCVKFYVSLSDNSKFATNNIAAHFSKKDMSVSDKKALIDKPSIREVNNRVFTGKFSWERVCGVYEAQGGEKFITIGNFNMTEDTKVEKIKQDASNKAPQIGGSYYYIDNVSVQLLEEGEKCDCGSDAYEEIGSSLIYSKSDIIKDNMTLEEKLRLSTVYFGFGRDMITGAANKDLERVVQLLKANPTARVRVIAHTDTEETKVAETRAEYKSVAMRRGNNVIKYLMDNGIAEDRFLFTDKGDRSPSPSDSSDEELNQAKNRRVEFQLIK